MTAALPPVTERDEVNVIRLRPRHASGRRHDYAY